MNEQLKKNLENESTETLLGILEKNDIRNRSSDTFDVIPIILKERGVALSQEQLLKAAISSIEPIKSPFRAMYCGLFEFRMGYVNRFWYSVLYGICVVYAIIKIQDYIPNEALGEIVFAVMIAFWRASLVYWAYKRAIKINNENVEKILKTKFGDAFATMTGS
ncbi:hypothetical protein ACFL43_02365 [Thermodesulfobacteriota bacterium]